MTKVHYVLWIAGTYFISENFRDKRCAWKNARQVHRNLVTGYICVETDKGYFTLFAGELGTMQDGEGKVVPITLAD